MIFKYITAASLIIAIGSSFIIRSKNSEIESLEKDISLKNSEIIILETDRNSLKSAIAEVNESIQKQNKELNYRQSIINELSARPVLEKVITKIKEIKSEPIIQECHEGLELLKNQAKELGQWED